MKKLGALLVLGLVLFGIISLSGVSAVDNFPCPSGSCPPLPYSITSGGVTYSCSSCDTSSGCRLKSCVCTTNCPLTCSDSCLAPENVQCGASLDNGCNVGCSDTGGMKCSLGLTCSNAKCVFFGNSIDNGLISMWTMNSADGTDSTKVVDVVSSYNGSVYGGAQQVAEGFKGQAFNLSTNKYIMVASNPYFQPSGNKTISVWIKPKVFSGILVSKYRTDTSEGGYVLMLNSNEARGLLKSNTWNTAMQGPNYQVSGSGSLSLSAWNNVVLTYDTSANIEKLYINGQYITQNTNLAGTFTDNPVNLIFGAEWYGGNGYSGQTPNTICSWYDCYYDGSIDEIGIWNRSLGASEVTQLYNSYFVLPPVCGNGVIESGEVCDEGTSNGLPNHCNSLCGGVTASICGNEIVEVEESCDNGTLNGQIDDCNLQCNGITKKCSGTLPANSVMNDNGLNGNFTQILNSSGSWVPESLSWSLNGVAGDCRFKCATNYTYDVATQTCIRTTVPISTCADLTTQFLCQNGATPAIAANSVPDKTKCDKTTAISSGIYNKTICICSWNSNQCQPMYNFTRVDTNTNINTSYGTCSFATTVDNKDCSSAAGEITLNYKASCSPLTNPCSKIDASCIDSKEDRACPMIEELPFFGFFEFMISVVSIVLVYTIFLRKK
ncbi:MAG: LamG domain-containing protein [Nanoarchaeota archaeon]